MRLRNLIEEIKKPVGKGIIIFDIDDTLVKAKDIFIYKMKDGKEVGKFTPDQFAKQDVKAEMAKGYTYDYRDFDNPDKLYTSIMKGEPLFKNLNMMDAHMRAGWDIGFLTARGMEQANKKAIKDWLLYRNEKGELVPIPEERVKYFIAVNDLDRKKELAKMAKSGGDFDAKGVYLNEIKKKYDVVKFVDDDMKNVLKARSVLPKKDVIVAHRHE